MEIKTSKEIYSEGLDIQWYNKKSNYDDKTTEKRKRFESKKWVTADDLKPIIKMLGKMSKQEIMVQCFQDEEQYKRIMEVYYALSETTPSKDG